VYETFDLPEDLKGYPPKASRQEQVRVAQENVKKLIPLFEVGNYMALLGSLDGTNETASILDNSTLCYEHIIDQKITTPEIYNNLGVNFLNKALHEIESSEFPFALPTELDFNSRLYSITNTGNGKGSGDDDFGYSDVDSALAYGNEDLIVQYCEQALSYFELALKIEESNIAAYNNSSAIYILLEDYDEAWVKARKARKLSKSLKNEIGLRNSLDLLAIVAYYNDEIEDANEYWDKALELNSRIASHNKLFINDDLDMLASDADDSGEGLLAENIFARPSFNDLEKVNGQSLYDIGSEYIYNGKAIETWQLKDQKAMVGKTEYEGGEFFIFVEMDRNRMLDSYFFYFVDGTSKMTTSLNLKNGSDVTDVQSSYGSPVRVMSSNTHDFWVYVKKNIIFKIDKQNKVDGWVLYDVNL